MVCMEECGRVKFQLHSNLPPLHRCFWLGPRRQIIGADTHCPQLLPKGCVLSESGWVLLEPHPPKDSPSICLFTNSQMSSLRNTPIPLTYGCLWTRHMGWCTVSPSNRVFDFQTWKQKGFASGSHHVISASSLYMRSRKAHRRAWIENFVVIKTPERKIHVFTSVSNTWYILIPGPDNELSYLCAWFVGQLNISIFAFIFNRCIHSFYSKPLFVFILRLTSLHLTGDRFITGAEGSRGSDRFPFPVIFSNLPLKNIPNFPMGGAKGFSSNGTPHIIAKSSIEIGRPEKSPIFIGLPA